MKDKGNRLMRMVPEIAMRMYLFMLSNCLYNEAVGNLDYIASIGGTVVEQ
jgi:hypothetical protein